MAHVRKLLRDRVTLMLTGLPTTGGRTRQNRASPLAKMAGISLAVRTPGETAEDHSMGGGQQRTVNLRCDLATKGSDEESVADLLDLAAVEVEKTFAADQTIGGLAETYQYRGATMLISLEGERTVGALSLAFEVLVFTDRGDPETPL